VVETSYTRLYQRGEKGRYKMKIGLKEVFISKITFCFWQNAATTLLTVGIMRNKSKTVKIVYNRKKIFIGIHNLNNNSSLAFKPGKVLKKFQEDQYSILF